MRSRPPPEILQFFQGPTGFLKAPALLAAAIDQLIEGLL